MPSSSPGRSRDDDPLRDLFSDGETPPTDLFDEHGLPLLGSEADRGWAHVLTAMEASIDEDGWDQPARLFAVASPSATEAMLPGQADAVRRLDAGDAEDDTVFSTSVAILPFGTIEGYPVVELVGFTFPQWAAAAIITFEGWVVRGSRKPDGSYGAVDLPAGMMPSQHPDRVEVRSVLMLTRSGLVRSVERVRGEGPEPGEDRAVGQQEGFLVDVLRRTLGLPVPDGGQQVSDYLGRLVLDQVVTALRHMLEGDYSDAPPEVQQAVADLRKTMATTGGDGQAVLAGLGVRQLVPALAQVVHLASGKGKRHIPRSAAKTVATAAAHPQVVDDDTVTTVMECAQALSGLSWEELALTRAARPLLPPLVEHYRWAGPQLLASWCCERASAPQRALLTDIEALAGAELADAARTLLDVCGWLVDEARHSVGEGTSSAE